MKNTTLILAGSLLCATLTLAGCNIVGGALYLAHGPETTPAVCTLPKDKTAVIAVDDRASVIPQRSLRDVIGKTAEEEILQHGLVKDMVASRLASAVMSRERAGLPMGIAEIGQAVQADIVIYVVIDRFALSEDRASVAPFARGRVKIVESKTGIRLAPPEGGSADYFPLSVQLPAQTDNAPNSANELGMLQDLARLTGVTLSRMFYDAEKMSEPKKLHESP